MTVLPTVQTIEPCCVVAATDCCACTVLSAERLACATASLRYPGYPSAPIAPLARPTHRPISALRQQLRLARIRPRQPRHRCLDGDRIVSCAVWRQRHSCARACTARGFECRTRPARPSDPPTRSTLRLAASARPACEHTPAVHHGTYTCHATHTCRANYSAELEHSTAAPRQRRPTVQGTTWRRARLHA